MTSSIALLRVRRFLRIKNEVDKTLIDLSMEDMIVTENEVKVLEVLVDILETVEIGASALSSNNIDLLRIDKVISFMLKKMENNSSDVGERMVRFLETRFFERRNSFVSGLLHYLSSRSQTELNLRFPSNAELLKKARDLYFRLFWLHANEDDTENAQVPDLVEDGGPTAKKSKVDELKMCLEEKEERRKSKSNKVDSTCPNIKRNKVRSFDP